MRKSKTVIVTLLFAALMCAVIALTACFTHVHTFETDFNGKDATGHWHKTTCGHDEKNGFEPHTFVNGVCTVCGYREGEGEGNTKTVRFLVGGGEGIAPMRFEVGAPMSALPTPTKMGYAFVCWQDGNGKTYTTSSIMPDTDLTLTAKWEKSTLKYADDYVSFTPANEGCKSYVTMREYEGKVDKFVYLDITSDDLSKKVGENGNFRLNSIENMEFGVRSGYTWTWFHGDFETQNFEQTFTLNYGSNFQFVIVSDSNGAVQRKYLVDIYVRHDYYVNLYESIFHTEPYDSVRVIENDRFAETEPLVHGNFEFDKRVYFNESENVYQTFDYSTPILKDIDLYQTYKPATIEANLDGGVLESELTATPYTQYVTLPTPTKDGYDFLGWKNDNGAYVTDLTGKTGKKFLSASEIAGIETDIAVSGGLTAVWSEKQMYYTVDTVMTAVPTAPVVTYTDELMTDISEVAYKPNGTDFVLSADDKNLAAVGKEFTLKLVKLGNVCTGIFDGETKLSDNALYTFVMPQQSFTYTASWAVAPEMENFFFTSTSDTCEITGVKNYKITELVIPDYVTSIGNGAFGFCRDITSVTIGANVKNIGKMAFKGCSHLTSVRIPQNVISIADDAFLDCVRLVEVFNKSTLNVAVGETANGRVGFYAKNVYTPTSGESKLSVDGSGFVVYDGNILVDYLGSATEIEIPGGITELNQYALYNHNALQSVTMPDSVITIGDNAFKGCGKLDSLTLSDNIANVSASAFDGCNITTITLPMSAISYFPKEMFVKVVLTNGAVIRHDTFTGCVNLTSITIPASVTQIDGDTFKGCTALKEVHIRDIAAWCGIRVLGSAYYFYHARNLYLNDELLTELVIPDGVEIVNERAFDSCGSITSVTFPNSVTTIGRRAFYGCNNLTEIALSDSVSKIDEFAFSNCRNLKNITIPTGVEVISTEAFKGCYRLIEVCNKSALRITAGDIGWGYVAYYAKNVYTDGSSKLSTDDNGFVIYNGNTLVDYLGSATEIKIPQNVTYINQYALYERSFLTKVTIPESVQSIGEAAFDSCNLTDVTMPAFAIAHIPKDKLKTVVITSGTEIAENAFKDCASITKIQLPDSIQRVGDNAFDGCSALKFNEYGNALYLGNDSNRYVVLVKAKNTDITYCDVYGNTKVICSFAFYGCRKLSRITLPFVGASKNATTANYDTVFGYIFGYITDSQYVGVNQYENYSYYIPSSLNKVTVTGGKILDYAFRNCENLTKITIGSGVTNFGKDAFYGCKELKEVYFDGDIADWCNIGFQNTYATPMHYAKKLYLNGELVTEIVIQDGITEIKEYAFYNCVNLTSITIPKSVTSIGAYAFYGCTGITVYYGGTAEEWDNISINADGNYYLINAPRTYYSETEPANSDCYYWHYDTDGITPIVWTKET